MIAKTESKTIQIETDIVSVWHFSALAANFSLGVDDNPLQVDSRNTAFSIRAHIEFHVLCCDRASQLPQQSTCIAIRCSHSCARPSMWNNSCRYVCLRNDSSKCDEVEKRRKRDFREKRQRGFVMNLHDGIQCHSRRTK